MVSLQWQECGFHPSLGNSMYPGTAKKEKRTETVLSIGKDAGKRGLLLHCPQEGILVEPPWGNVRWDPLAKWVSPVTPRFHSCVDI